MAADRSYVDANRAALDRLKGFVEKASDADLKHPMDDGWTVASVLAHAAFWDLRVVACVDAWGPDGSGPVPTYDDESPLCRRFALGAPARLAMPCSP